ncbi:uncharacterized protein LOC121871216 [Homarus americanus]|uniref:uncharacterized protein LOC121871216 n=1 Tax=Homarus americanus TaxID=6706 RepID=UPI001C448D7B|nr:uncharacterized protein LOC121871216 [Homarus americanus]
MPQHHRVLTTHLSITRSHSKAGNSAQCPSPVTMTRYTVVVLWAVMLLVDTAHTRRARIRNRSSDHFLSQSRVPLFQEPWVPRRVNRLQAAQGPQFHQTREHWLPQQMVQQTQSHRRRESWEPLVVQQTQQSHLPEDSWLPHLVQQSQIEVLDGSVQQTQQRPIRDDCKFSFDDVPQKHIHPMLVKSDNKGFIYPYMEGKNRMMHIAKGTSIIASCPGTDNTLIMTGRLYSYISCKSGRLMYGKKPIEWSDLGCNKKPTPTMQEGEYCGRGGKTHIIGWSIRRHVYIPQITLCFNEHEETTLYAFHQVHGRNINAKVVETSRPGFRAGKMFSQNSSNMRRSYSKTSQRLQLSNLTKVTEHLTAEKQHFLAKGHLAPDSDFVLEPEQDATYYYSNVVPQWQSVNNGNWKRLEYAVRELAESRGVTLDVWTGTHGLLELPNQHSEPIKVFLGVSSGREVLPIPALMWKVIHDPTTHTAVAIVEVNDVRGKGTSDSWSLLEPPCPDVCHQLPWIDWDTSNFRYGRTFCCSVDSLKTTIAELPSLGYVSLLQQ